MDYEFWFWFFVAFIIGRISTRPIFYYGKDEEKYKNALIAVMPR